MSVVRRSIVTAHDGDEDKFDYHESMTASPVDLKSAAEAGDRFEQTFALSAFVSALQLQVRHDDRHVRRTPR